MPSAYQPPYSSQKHIWIGTVLLNRHVAICVVLQQASLDSFPLNINSLRLYMATEGEQIGTVPKKSVQCVPLLTSAAFYVTMGQSRTKDRKAIRKL